MLWALAALALAAAALLLIWMFLTMPQLPRRPLGNLAGLYAHRGLWNEKTPENSLAAFKRAAEKGFGIELDVQRTADGELVIFHDEDLERLCGVRWKVELCTLRELRELRLGTSDQGIPTLREALETVDGRVPLLIDFKPCRAVVPMCERADALLQHYAGPYCVESFDPRAVRWYRRHRPNVIRGQLARGLERPILRHWDRRAAWNGSLIHHVRSRPDFVSMRWEDRNRLPLRMARAWKPWLAAWTLTTPEALAEARRECELLIFEQFTPGQEKEEP